MRIDELCDELERLRALLHTAQGDGGAEPDRRAGSSSAAASGGIGGSGGAATGPAPGAGWASAARSGYKDFLLAAEVHG